MILSLCPNCSQRLSLHLNLLTRRALSSPQTPYQALISKPSNTNKNNYPYHLDYYYFENFAASCLSTSSFGLFIITIIITIIIIIIIILIIKIIIILENFAASCLSTFSFGLFQFCAKLFGERKQWRLLLAETLFPQKK